MCHPWYIEIFHWAIGASPALAYAVLMWRTRS